MELLIFKVTQKQNLSGQIKRHKIPKIFLYLIKPILQIERFKLNEPSIWMSFV